jgi:hypothetical protein
MTTIVSASQRHNQVNIRLLKVKDTNIGNTGSRIVFCQDILRIDQIQLENLEFLRYLGSILANDGRCACEFKSSIAMAKAALTRRRLFLLAKWT